MKETILDALGRRVLIFDGATGTVLQSMGLSPGEPSDGWNVSRPDGILALHRLYLEAGADIIKTNTFVTARPGNEEAARSLTEAGCALARRAVTEAGRGFVALDMGSTGHLLAPLGDLEFEAAVSLFKTVVSAGAPFCDLVLIETQTDVREAKAAVIAAKEACSLPVFVSATVTDGRLLSGADIETFAAVMEGLGVSAVGLNCGVGPDAMERELPRLLAATRLPVFVSPNAGLPVVDGDNVHYDVDTDTFAESELRMARLGAAAIGGCCGTTPEYIKKTADMISGMKARVREHTPVMRAASATRTVVFGSRPVIIGERINPTGKPKLKEALRRLDASDMDHIVSLAYSQADAGADALDINCGVPETDEAETLVRVVAAVEAAVPLPLVIDTSDPYAMEAAMRTYGGKAVVNSVNGRREVMDAVFPLVKKYGGVVIGLALDENGIPDTADGRFRIAERIVSEAEKYGIPRSDILIDALTLTVAADGGAAGVTLEVVRRVREELGVGTVLGVSNVSFGLPDRDAVNAAFLTLALASGLTAAIMNPESAPMRGALAAYRALTGDFSALGTSLTSPSSAANITSSPSAENNYTLAEAVFMGRKSEAARLASGLLERGHTSMEIIDGEIIPGLTRLGEQYEKGYVFLPALIAGADAATAAFSEIKRLLPSSDGAPSRGVVVLATVEGDVHDIGKNIVSAIMSNYGYDVHDLGRDVKPERIVKETLATGARLVGLSALMTTTVPAMKHTIEALRAACDCKIVVGGAVITQELAEKIGADYYSPDAMTNVRIAAEVYGE